MTFLDSDPFCSGEVLRKSVFFHALSKITLKEVAIIFRDGEILDS